MEKKKTPESAKREIVASILALPPKDQCEIMITLGQKIDTTLLPPDPNAHLSDEEWTEELAGRIQSIFDGTAETIPAEEVFKDIRDSLN